MKKILVIGLMMILCGCSCSTTKTEPTSTPTASPTPSSTPESSLTQDNSSVNDYLNYLSSQYTINHPTQIDELDSNAKEGLMFGINDAEFYLLKFDRNNENASQWFNEAMERGYIEVKINDELKKYYALINRDYMLLYDTENLESGFEEYFKNYDFTGETNNQQQP